MIKKLIIETKNIMFTKPGLLKLAFGIGFARSISILLLLAYNINNLLIYRFEKGLSILTLFQYFIDQITQNGILWLVIIIAIIIGLGYALLYPIGIAALIHFVKSNFENIPKAIGKGTKDFFSMFELNALAFSFGPYTYSITILRLITLDVINSGFVIGLIVLWGIIVLFASIFWQYAKFIIIEEQIGVFDAIKKSISITITNMGISIKGILTKTIIMTIFYIKMIIISAIPLLIIYGLISTNLVQNNSWIIRTLGIITCILAAYIISITQAFFTTFWYKIYQIAKKKED